MGIVLNNMNNFTKENLDKLIKIVHDSGYDSSPYWIQHGGDIDKTYCHTGYILIKKEPFNGTPKI